MVKQWRLYIVDFVEGKSVAILTTLIGQLWSTSGLHYQHRLIVL